MIITLMQFLISI